MTMPDPQTSDVNQDDPEYTPTESTRKSLTKRGMYHERLMKTCWNRWRKEYLVSLRQFHQHSKLTKTPESSVNLDGVVIVHNTRSRNQRRLAIVKVLLWTRWTSSFRDFIATSK